MSVEIYGFLGEDILNIQQRFIEKFNDLGFEIALDPAANLLGFSSVSSISTIRIAILETPSDLLRLSPKTPLLVEIEYYAVAKKDVLNPPRKVQNYTYLAYSRTSAGRSNSSGYIQMLIIAILASISKGKYFSLGDKKPVSGDAAIEDILANLNAKEENYEALLATYKNKKTWHEKNNFLPTLNSSFNSPFFDEEAISFIGWNYQYSGLDEPIKNRNKIALIDQNFFMKWLKRQSWFEIFGYLVMLYFLITLIKSEM